MYTCPVNLKYSKNANEFELREVDSLDLVPGDVIEVPEGKMLPCDLILLSGSVIVNEAILTGESIPVIKASLPAVSNETYSSELSKKHTLYGGTHVIKTKPVGNEPVYALVAKTGF